MIYYWRAVDAGGSVKSGELESLSPTVAEQQLKSRGFRSIEVSTSKISGSVSVSGAQNAGRVFVALAILTWIGAAVFVVIGLASGTAATIIPACISMATGGLMLYAIGAVIGLLSEAVELLRTIASRK